MVDTIVEERSLRQSENVSTKQRYISTPIVHSSTSAAMVDTIVEQQLPPPVRKCFNQKEVQ